MQYGCLGANIDWKNNMKQLKHQPANKDAIEKQNETMLGQLKSKTKRHYGNNFKMRVGFPGTKIKWKNNMKQQSGNKHATEQQNETAP